MTPKWLHIPLFGILFFMMVQPSAAASLNETSLFKVEAVTEHETFYWEFTSPSSFKYRSTNIAEYSSVNEEEKVRNLFNALDLHQNTSKEEVLSAFGGKFPHRLKRLEVKWQEENGELYTWLWQQ